MGMTNIKTMGTGSLMLRGARLVTHTQRTHQTYWCLVGLSVALSLFGTATTLAIGHPLPYWEVMSGVSITLMVIATLMIPRMWRKVRTKLEAWRTMTRDETIAEIRDSGPDGEIVAWELLGRIAEDRDISNTED